MRSPDAGIDVPPGWPGDRALAWPDAAPFGPGFDRPLPPVDRPGADAILCFHGFPSTPRNYRLVAGAAAERGFETVAPLMPGCGTDPKDILRFSYGDWAAFGKAFWLALRPRWRRLWLVGTSVGGSVALEIAAEFSKDPGLAPSGIATIGAPVALNAVLRHGMMKSPLLYVAKPLSRLVPTLGAALPDPEREGEDGDEHWLGYLGVYTAFSASLQAGLRALERRLPEIRLPILALHEVRDRMIDHRNAGLVARLAGAGAEVVDFDMGDARHMRHDLLLYDSTRERAWSTILDRFDRIRADGGK